MKRVGIALAFALVMLLGVLHGAAGARGGHHGRHHGGHHHAHPVSPAPRTFSFGHPATHLFGHPCLPPGAVIERPTVVPGCWRWNGQQWIWVPDEFVM